MQLMLAPTEKDYFFLYTVKQETGPILYVGADKLINIVLIKELLTIPEFDRNRVYIVDILSPYQKYYQALNAVSEFIRSFCGGNHPYFNLLKHIAKSYPVQCVQTGIIYDSANEACKALAIHNSRMSSHLNNKPGHKTIKGLSFRHHKQGSPVTLPPLPPQAAPVYPTTYTQQAMPVTLPPLPPQAAPVYPNVAPLPQGIK